MNLLNAKVVLATIIVMTTVSPVARGQTADLSGIIKDKTGAIIQGAAVTVANENTGIVRKTVSNDRGAYWIPVLNPGLYRVTVSASGFHSLAKTGVVLNAADRAALDIILDVGTISTEVTVESETTPLLQTTPAIGLVIDREFVANAPLNGRSFQMLLAMTPGIVLAVANPGNQGQFSVNGQRTNANYFMIDGVSANFGSGTGSGMGTGTSGSTPAWSITGGTNGLISVDAMQEFRIQTSTYAPEFGRMPGAQVSIVTRSGTRAFHGSVFDYLRNDIFDARDYFNRVPEAKPALRQNNFGITLGGPIRKDQLFFFFSYEGLRLRQPHTETANFFTAAARAKMASVWKPFVNSSPIPDGPVNPDGFSAPLTMNTSLPVTQDAISLRVDHSPTQSLNTFVRYNHAPSNSISGFSDASRQKNTSDIETLTIGATYSIDGNRLNDFRANWSRNIAGQFQYAVPFYGAVIPPENVLYPAGFSSKDTQIYGNVLGTATGFMIRAGQFSDNVQRQLHFVDTFSWTAGRHSIRFGFDWRGLRPSPSFTKNSIALYASYSDLQAGTIAFCFCAAGGGNTLALGNYSTFVQDSWRLSNRLTMTYGLRWEINPPPSSATETPVYAMQGVFDTQTLGLAPAGTPLWHTQYANFAPRVGAAWQITSRTVLRGGTGVFFDLGTPSVLGETATSTFPWMRSRQTMVNVPFTYSDPTQFQAPAFALKPTANASPFVKAFDPGLKTPRSYHWNVSFDRELSTSQSISVAWIASKGQDLIRGDNLRPADNGVNWYITAFRNADRSRYDSLQVSFQRRRSRGLQMLLSYTLARGTDTRSTDYVSTTPDLGATRVSDLPDVGINEGYSDFDVRHSLAGAFSWELPSPGNRRAGRTLLKGWALDGIVMARQGLPINVVALSTVLWNGVYQRIRPDLVSGQPIWISDANAPGGRHLNSAAFAMPADNRPGTLIRNSIRNFPLFQADLALRRRFDLTDRVKMDLRVEYFNVFNHPNLALGANDVYWHPVYGGFGYATMTQNDYLSGSFFSNQGGSVSPQYAAGGSRSGQFTIKISF